MRKGVFRFLAVLLIVAELFAGLSAEAQKKEFLYIVKVNPGLAGETAVAGETIEIRSDYANWSASPEPGKFFTDPDRGHCFCLPENPFAAPAGYVFTGWIVKGDSSVRPVGYQMPVDAIITLTAQWTREYTISGSLGDSFAQWKELQEKSIAGLTIGVKLGINDAAYQAGVRLGKMIVKDTAGNVTEITSDVYGENVAETTHLETQDGYRVYSLKFTMPASDVIVSAVFNREFATITEAPQARSLVYTGQSQQLITAGAAMGGTMQYGLGLTGASGPTSGWRTTIPEAMKPGLYFVYYRAAGDEYHRDTEFHCLMVTIGKVKARVVTLPTIRNLTYTGEPQALVNAGTAEGGTMQYALVPGLSQIPGTGWSAEIPTGVAAGTYYVAYKAAGDENHEDSDVGWVTAVIQEAAAPSETPAPVQRIDIGQATIRKIDNQVYTGEPIRPEPVVTYKGKTLTKGKDYKVGWKNNTKIGNAKVIVTGIGRYKGKKQATFRIVKGKLPKPTGVKVTSGKKKLTVKWKMTNKNRKRISGFEIEYSRYKNFSNAVRVRVGRKATKKVLGKLNKKTLYYVRIRSYLKSGGKTSYSAWVTKKAKTK